jgi:hypothetical protein
MNFQVVVIKFEQPDYQDLYENHSHQKSNDKLGGYVNISFIPKERVQKRLRRTRQNRALCFRDFKYNSKYLKRDLNIKIL